MLELLQVPTDVVGCFGHPTAIDRLATQAERSFRVAPNELLLLGTNGRRAGLEAELSLLDSAAVVLDLSGGFVIWELRGDDRLEAFCRLSELELPAPPSAVQGLVAHVPAKVLVGQGELLLVVSSVVSHDFHERILTACADLVRRERELIPEEAVT